MYRGTTILSLSQVLLKYHRYRYLIQFGEDFIDEDEGDEEGEYLLRESRDKLHEEHGLGGD